MDLGRRVSVYQATRSNLNREKALQPMPFQTTSAEAEAEADRPFTSDTGVRGLQLTGSRAAARGFQAVERLVGSVRHRMEPSDLPPADRRAAEGAEEPRGLVLRPALLGFVAMVAIAVGASLPSSPFKLEMPNVWFFGVPKTAAGSQWGVYFTLTAVYGGLLLLMRVWWGMTRLYSRCPGVAVKRMVWVFALWATPMLIIAPLFSRDVYSYAAQGEMVSHHVNPYMYGPFQLGNNSFTAPVDPLWGNAPAPYGPMFLFIDGWFTRITFHNELATIVLLRLLELFGVVLIAVCVPRLARLYHRDGAELFTLMVLNPVTLLHLIGGAHNDALMLGLLTLGITLAKEKRPLAAAVLCALATAVKAPAAAGILYVGWTWLGPEASVRDRIRPVATATLIGVGVLGFFSYISGLGWGWVTILGTPGAVRSWTAPTTSISLAVTGIAHFVGIGVGSGGVLAVTRVLGIVTACLISAWLLFNSDRIGTLKALGITLLLFVLLGPVVQPWYLSWGLVLLAPVALGRLRSVLIGLSMVTAFIELPGGTDLVKSLLHGDPLQLVLTLLWILVVLTVPLSTWGRGPGPSKIESMGTRTTAAVGPARPA
ncbi:MAG: polyprenol phosphomannose-dependent alpha 1,6 mannosyltransferase MptB [Acidimicrobiales bacterium]